MTPTVEDVLAYRGNRDFPKAALKLEGNEHVSTASGEVQPLEYGKVCATMCVWKRPAWVAACLVRLAKQEYDGEIEVRMWNNCPELQHCYDRIARHVENEYGMQVQVLHSQENLRCWPRYAFAALSNCEYVITIDDEVMAKPGLVATLVKHVKESGMACGSTGRVLRGKNYWGSIGFNIRSAKVYEANCLNGVLVCYLASWIRNPLLYKVPEDFPALNKHKLCADDLWASFCMYKAGIRMKKVDVRKLVRLQGLPDKEGQELIKVLRMNTVLAAYGIEDADKIPSIGDQQGVYTAKHLAMRVLANIDSNYFTVGDETTSGATL